MNMNQQNKHTPQAISMQRLMNIRDVSEYTGLSIHTLYAMVSKRQIPYVKVGRLTKFPPDLIEKWLKQNTHLPDPPKAA
jgi:excisionase family DNA binding protein